MTAPTRPVLRYHGGKWRLAPWVISFFPPHRIYVEAYGGAASVLMRKEPTYAEVYNDLDGEVVNVFRVLREPSQALELSRLLALTPYARDEFTAAYQDADVDAVERARRTIIKAFMGFGSDAIRDAKPRGMRTRASTHRVPPTGFRSNSNRSHTTPALDWLNYPAQLERFCARLAGVVIENHDAIATIRCHDREEALIYCDPPYVHSTRRPKKKGVDGGGYRHEMTDADHRRLAETLRCARGMVVVSGYPCELYDRELYHDWERHERQHLADGARKRTEVVWLNAACSEALRGRAQGSLLEVANG